MTGCAFMQNRTFITEMDKDTDGFWVAGRDFGVTSGDSGNPYRTKRQILERTPASKMEAQEMMQERLLSRELAKKEARLRGHELTKYNEYSDYFESDSERIYYLSLSSYERDEFMRNKGVANVSSQPRSSDRLGSRAGLMYIRKRNEVEREIWLGMTEDDVIQAWGRPSRVEVAGNPRYRNERWVFYENGRSKFIYFEGGTVQGWAID